MYTISVVPKFYREIKKLPVELVEEAYQKIELLRDKNNHKGLKVHKLKGLFFGRYSFSVNYQTRIVFKYNPNIKNEIVLLAIGDHDVYKE